MTLPIDRVDRVIEDEVIPGARAAADAAQEAAEELKMTAIPLHFEETQAKVPDGPYGPMIFEAAKRHALNPQVVAALIRAESAGNIRAVSNKGARVCGGDQSTRRQYDPPPAVARKCGSAAWTSQIGALDIDRVRVFPVGLGCVVEAVGHAPAALLIDFEEHLVRIVCAVALGHHRRTGLWTTMSELAERLHGLLDEPLDLLAPGDVGLRRQHFGVKRLQLRFGHQQALAAARANATRQPSSANMRAVARPMPLLPPVISATRPLIDRSIMSTSREPGDHLGKGVGSAGSYSSLM